MIQDGTGFGVNGDRPLVLVLDSHSLRRAAVAQLMQAWVRSARLELLAAHPDVDLTEIATTSEDGIAMVVLSVGGVSIATPPTARCIDAVKRLLPQTPVVIMSDREEADELILAFQTGVRGFIPTSLEPDVAMHTLAFILGGGSFYPPGAMMSPARTDGEVGSALRPTRQITIGVAVQQVSVRRGALTARQREVLDLLRQGKTNKMIGRDLDMQEATVKVHVRQIMRKMGAANRTEVALLAVQAESAAVAHQARADDGEFFRADPDIVPKWPPETAEPAEIEQQSDCRQQSDGNTLVLRYSDKK